MQNETSNKEISRRFVQQIFNEGKLSQIGDFVAADAWNHEYGEEPAPAGRSPEFFAGLVRLYRDAFPDLHVEVQGQVAEDDQVVTSLRLKGTQEGPLMGIPSHGKSMEVDGIRIDRFVDDKIAESWFQWDSVGMLRQLGVLPILRERKMPTSEPAPATATVLYLPVPEEAPAKERSVTFTFGSTSVTATPGNDGTATATLTLREMLKAS
jgi:predicted ester cyclase